MQDLGSRRLLALALGAGGLGVAGWIILKIGLAHRSGAAIAIGGIFGALALMALIPLGTELMRGHHRP